nr:DUF4832 domain-containing protein [Chloroflexaceae bacterium]
MRLVHTLVSLALLPLLLPGGLPTQAAPTQTISYQASDENFTNPERGFYIQRAPIWRNDERGPLQKDDLLAARSQGMSMVRTYYLLEPYRNKPLAQSVLDQLTTDFATARTAGVKLVLRFSYNFGIGEADAPVNQVLAHIDQLAPVLRANADVIAFMEAGFVGAWGEWHSSTNNLIGPDGVNANTRQIAEKLLSTLPSERMVAVRTPAYKQQLTGASPLTVPEAYSGSNKARIGAHNDCFLASRTDWGTYPEDEAGIAAAKQFLNQDNQFLPQGGETCNFAEDAQPYIGCENALAELARMRWSTINSEYEEQVLQGWKNGGCYDTIAKKLGYRFRLISASIPSSATPGTALSLSMQLANDGFARPYNPRGLELVLRNKTSGAVSRLPVGQGDTRLVLPGPGETKTLTLTANLPAALAPGSYEVLLNLPDPAPALNTRPEYSMRLANQNTWEATTGYNKLNASVTLSAVVTQPPGSTPPPGTTLTPRPAPGGAKVFLPLVQRNAASTARPTATARPSPSATAAPSPSATPSVWPSATPAPPATGETRDPWLWPFAQDSIWNMPIGSNARYEAANLKPAGWTGSDAELLYKVPAGAPERPVYDPASWELRCAGTAVADPGRRKTLPIPDDLIVARVNTARMISPT